MPQEGVNGVGHSHFFSVGFRSLFCNLFLVFGYLFAYPLLQHGEFKNLSGFVLQRCHPIKKKLTQIMTQFAQTISEQFVKTVPPFPL